MDDLFAHHVLAVVKNVGRAMGGLSVQCHIPVAYAQETFDAFTLDERHLRVQWISVDRQGVVVVHRDETYGDRVGHPDDWRRIQRLDNLEDVTVADVRSRRPRIVLTAVVQCDWHAEHDEVNDRPTGERCQAAATHRLVWLDGSNRVSYGCDAHLELKEGAPEVHIERLSYRICDTPKDDE
jgi:hypothetical protein